ncbi:MAG: hypothetical protein ABJE95_20330 [Byssovorax sp.]
MAAKKGKAPATIPSNPGKPPVAEGGGTYGLQTDNDGTTNGTEEILSAQKLARAQKKDAGPPASDDYLKTWKNAVIDALDKDPRYKKEAQYLRDQDWVNQTPNSGADAFGDIVGGKFYNGGKSSPTQVYQNYFWNSPKGDIHHPRGMAKDLIPLLDDPAWQPVTSVARVMPDGTRRFADPYSSYYVVANKTGGLGVVTDPKTGEQFVGPTDDTNPDAFGGKGHTSDNGEVSNALVQQIPGKKAQIDIYRDTAGSGTPGYLTNDEWKEALGYVKKGWKINNRADLLKARAGGLLLLYGYWSVMHGVDERAVGFADPTSLHLGGGFVKEGSDRTFVGDQFLPLSRVGDATSDNFTIATGALDFYVGGIPTTPRPTPPEVGKLDKAALAKANAEYKKELATWKDVQSAYNPFYIPTKN